jgi:hypothetical protein
LKKPTNRTIIAAVLASGLVALPGLAYGATLNQNLGGWQDDSVLAAASPPDIAAPLIIVDPVGALPPFTKPQPQLHVQAKRKAPLPPPVVERPLTDVEIVNKSINPGASDPDVPLPRPGLAETAAGEPTVGNGPRMFGRGEEGGGVFGLRVPIPAVLGAGTRYSPGRTNPDATR